MAAGAVTPVAFTEDFIKAFAQAGMAAGFVAAGLVTRAFAVGVADGEAAVGSHRLSG